MKNRNQGVVSLDFLLDVVAAGDFAAVAHELAESRRRSANGLHTEAVLRLGRATEASIYAAAEKFGIDPTLGIRELANLHAELAGTESRILKSTTADEVHHHFDNLTKRLARVAKDMQGDFTKAQGRAGQTPRGSSRILKDIQLNATKSHTKRKADRTRTLLRHVMNARNDSAHASPHGHIREVIPPDFDRLRDDGVELILSIILFTLGQASRRDV
jgi:hypothetical protein